MSDEQEQTTAATEEIDDNDEYGEQLTDTLFPYVDNKKHWDIDFNDTNQSYEGSALPAWVLAGFAIYIIWAATYLIVALSAG